MDHYHPNYTIRDIYVTFTLEWLPLYLDSQAGVLGRKNRRVRELIAGITFFMVKLLYS